MGKRAPRSWLDRHRPARQAQHASNRSVLRRRAARCTRSVHRRFSTQQPIGIQRLAHRGAGPHRPTPSLRPDDLPATGRLGPRPSFRTATSTGEEAAVSGAEPNAVGQVVCDLIPVLPENVVTDLARLLSASLADPSFIQRSTIRLGVLIGVVADGTGEIPSTRAYDDARKAAVDGDAFPTASGLSRVYGGWLNAVDPARAIHINDQP